LARWPCTAVAWDGLQPETNQHVYGDVNGDGLCSVLVGHDDWVQATPSSGVFQDTNFALGFQCNTGNWADGAKPPSTIEDREMTAYQALVHGRVTLPGGVPYAKNCPAPGATVNGNLKIAAGDACALIGATVRGNVEIEHDAILQVQYSTIRGNLDVDGAKSVVVDAASSIGGNFSANGAGGVGLAAPVGGNVQIAFTWGSLPGGNYVCSSNIAGNLSLAGSGPSGGFDVGSCQHCAAGNVIRGNAQIDLNLGAITFSRNTVNGNVQCYLDASVVSGENSVTGHNSGECDGNVQIQCGP